MVRTPNFFWPRVCFTETHIFDILRTVIYWIFAEVQGKTFKLNTPSYSAATTPGFWEINYSRSLMLVEPQKALPCAKLRRLLHIMYGSSTQRGQSA